MLQEFGCHLKGSKNHWRVLSREFEINHPGSCVKNALEGAKPGVESWEISKGQKLRVMCGRGQAYATLRTKHGSLL